MANPKISVVTVSYNCVDTIETTILSVINQDYVNIEYIIIDGESTDGTVDIIKKYQAHIAYWVSEPDGGIYEAMNKGIDKATGEWINFMNSGDVFTTKHVLSSVFNNVDYSNIDVIYGNSTSTNKNTRLDWIAGANVDELSKKPIYRHGASFVSAPIHKAFKFDVSLKKKLGFALDFHCINKLYMAKKQFKKVDVNILTYIKEGESDQLAKAIWYNYLITRSKPGIDKYLLIACLKMMVVSIVPERLIETVKSKIYKKK